MAKNRNRQSRYGELLSITSYTVKRDYCHFKSVLAADQITVIGTEMSV